MADFAVTVTVRDAAGHVVSQDVVVHEQAPVPAFPDATTTGPVGTLTTWTGSLTFNTPGQVVENKLFQTSGGVTVTANNVTFRNCKFVYTGAMNAISSLVEANPVTGTLFDHCELDGRAKVARAIHAGDSFTVQYCNIHDTGNGVEAGWAFTVRECYIWNIFTPTGQDWHADGVQAWDGAHDMLIDHNTILLPQVAGSTGAVDFVGGTPQSNNLVQNNLLAGAGYTIYVGSPNGNTNVRVINNRLSTRYFPRVGFYNIWYTPDAMPNVVRTGNVIHETGAPANGNI